MTHSSPLGQQTSYPTEYAPSILHAILRDGRRDVFFGYDTWCGFELSWCDSFGVPKVGLLRMTVDAKSTYITESKSLKLYLNSLNFMHFDSAQTLAATIQKDIANCIKHLPVIEIFDLSGQLLHQTNHHAAKQIDTPFLIAPPVGVCIDEMLTRYDEDDDVNTAHLMFSEHSEAIQYCFYSQLLRSNCPVTNQPDWGTLMVNICTKKALDYAAVLRYILSYRKHNGFHESCIEQVFMHFMQYLAPVQLSVLGNYTRRGGLDISPYRTSMPDFNDALAPIRLIRQ